MLNAHCINQRGYSLIELIITIALTGIAVIIFFSVFAVTQRQSVEPVFQVKSAELGQAYLEEIGLKRYDENSPTGNALRCDAPSAPACSGALGAEGGETRVLFDDIDDYHNLSDSPPQDALGNNRTGFNSFTVNVSVTYAGTDFGLTAQALKRIQVTVIAPDTSRYVFSQYRGNF
ncbi:type IV pilus modification PilV family protein [Aliikangiella coralliicola]|uniref:Prepilin-type N-terminal cleavage/methylation domain-containing protein n=1 Tax=Aliikangiella coralliicola TaxID=2592383 RepID=A0A545UGM1_9GAMM|nr:prepilin-type N-terminal cleavage/methylation domain-containing protein [Aliikangiella coralliicola]TQV88543.1 prepilin-type N-terminal cleavage/methylation domain-containing protein [Aliikangiella coralliicola]